MTIDRLDLDPSETALLLMDFEPAALGSLPDGDQVVECAARTLNLFRHHSVHVAHVRMALDDLDIEAFPATNMLAARLATLQKAVHVDSPLTIIDSRVAPIGDETVVRKVRVGAFSTTDLDARLRQRGIDTLVLAGVRTSGVILSTVRDGADRDFRMFVLSDATADPDDDTHRFLLDKVIASQARVITIDDLDTALTVSHKESGP